MNIISDFQFRGLIYQSTDLDALKNKLKAPITVYCGFDPTADSLHIGSLLPILCLKRLQIAGHIPIALVGGGTGLIGDPSGKTTERTLNTSDIVEKWTSNIKSQLERFLDFDTFKNSAVVVNNFSWLSEIKIMDFFRDIGKNFTINSMLAKESVNARLEKGISFTEFSYMLLQSYDYLKLHQDYNCTLQIGGSDQWGNITLGIDLIGKINKNEVYGLTMPLLVKSDGKKFGKTEGGTIWLDPKKTTPYQFYQFWLNTDDADVGKFLRYFTFLSKETIMELEEEVKRYPEKREAQRILAKEVTDLVHGTANLQTAEKISLVLFNGNVGELSSVEIMEAFKEVPSTSLQKTESAINIIDLLILTRVSSSKRQAKQDIESGSIYLNGRKATNTSLIIGKDDTLYGKYIVLRRGKKNYHLAEFN